MFKVGRHVPEMGTTSDEELFSLMKDAKTDPGLANKAWNEFYKRYSHYLWKCCLNACKNISEGEEVANDIFQDTMIKIHDNANLFNPEKNTGTKAWIGRIAKNIFLDYFNQHHSKFSPFDELVKEPEDEEYSEEEEETLYEKLLALKKEQLQNLLSVLNKKEYKVLMTYMNYYQIDKPNAHLPDEETKKLCLEFNIKSDLRQIKKRAIDKLKRAIIKGV